MIPLALGGVAIIANVIYNRRLFIALRRLWSIFGIRGAARRLMMMNPSQFFVLFTNPCHAHKLRDPRMQSDSAESVSKVTSDPLSSLW